MDTIEKRLITLQSVTKRLAEEASRIQCAVEDITAAIAPTEQEKDRWTLEEILKVYGPQLWEQFCERKPNDLIAGELGLPVLRVVEARKKMKAPLGTGKYLQIAANRKRNKEIVAAHRAGRSNVDIGQQFNLSGTRVGHLLLRETTISYWVHPHPALHYCCVRWQGRWCYVGSKHRDVVELIDWCKGQGLKPIRLDDPSLFDEVRRKAADRALETQLPPFKT